MPRTDQQKSEKLVSLIAKFSGYAFIVFGYIVGKNFAIPALSAAAIYIIAKRISLKREDAYRIVLSLNVGYACWFLFCFFVAPDNAEPLVEGCLISILSIAFYLWAFNWVAYILAVYQIFGLYVNGLAVMNFIDSPAILKPLAVHILFRVSCVVSLVFALFISRKLKRSAPELT